MKSKIKEIANKKSISLYRIAKDLKISENTVYRWAKNKGFPRPENLEKLCNFLNCSLNDLFEIG